MLVIAITIMTLIPFHSSEPGSQNLGIPHISLGRSIHKNACTRLERLDRDSSREDGEVLPLPQQWFKDQLVGPELLCKPVGETHG